MQLPSLSIPEAHYNLGLERDLNVQGPRLNEAQPAPLIDSHGLAMGIPVGEEPLLLMPRCCTPCTAFVCPDILSQAAFNPQLHCELKVHRCLSAVCRAFIHMVEEIPRQGRLEGCHRLFAATHLICG